MAEQVAYDRRRPRHETTLTITLDTEAEQKLAEIAAENGQDRSGYARNLLERQVRPPRLETTEEGTTRLDRAVARATSWTPEQIAEAQRRAMETCRPERPLPPGETWLDVISGQWPGDETDEQINAFLDQLS